MYKQILIATDGSDLARKGVDHGLSLAKSLASEVVVFTVTEPLPVYVGEGWALGPDELGRYEADQKKFARELLEPIKASAGKLGFPCETLHVPGRRPARGFRHDGLLADRHGFARPSWTWPPVARQPDTGRVGQFGDTRAGGSIAAMIVWPFTRLRSGNLTWIKDSVSGRGDLRPT